MNFPLAAAHDLLDHPWIALGVFVLASMLMIWRLQAMERKGFEGTLLGTLIMPYCSGFANLAFAFVMGRAGGNGQTVMENCLVNNVTNLTLILGLAALFWAGKARCGSPARATAAQRLSRLDLLLTLAALFLFTGTLWALGRDGRIDFNDGLVLVALFLFWQLLHIFEVLKGNVRKNRSLHISLIVDLALIGIAAAAVYFSIEHLVAWIGKADGRILHAGNLGWLSGVLMVLPNAIIAFHFARGGRQDIVVSSQVGDSHICIPMCIGLYALFDPIAVPRYFETGVQVVLAAGAIHLLTQTLLGRTPRLVGGGLIAGYIGFMVSGVVA